MLGLCCYSGFSPVAQSGSYSSCSVKASHCSGLSCRAQAPGCISFSSCGSWALEHRLSSCGARAQQLCGMWDLPRSGTEPMSPAMADGFPPLSHEGSPHNNIFKWGQLITVQWPLKHSSERKSPTSLTLNQKLTEKKKKNLLRKPCQKPRQAKS